MISKPLSIRFKFLTIIGCYDIHGAVGKSTKGRPQSTVIVEAMDALIEGMRLEGKIPSYETDAEVEERLNEIFNIKPLQVEGGEGPLHLPSISINPEPLEEEFDEVRQVIDGAVSIIKQETDKPSGGLIELPSEKSEEDKETALTFEAIEAQAGGKDKLVGQCKGNKGKEYALTIVYDNLSPDVWGTDIAERVLNETLSLIMKDSKVEGE